MVIDGSGEGQMMVRWSGEVQMRVKTQKYSELDIGGRETCPVYWHFDNCATSKIDDVLIEHVGLPHILSLAVHSMKILLFMFKFFCGIHPSSLKAVC